MEEYVEGSNQSPYTLTTFGQARFLFCENVLNIFFEELVFFKYDLFEAEKTSKRIFHHIFKNYLNKNTKAGRYRLLGEKEIYLMTFYQKLSDLP